MIDLKDHPYFKEEIDQVVAHIMYALRQAETSSTNIYFSERPIALNTRINLQIYILLMRKLEDNGNEHIT